MDKLETQNCCSKIRLLLFKIIGLNRFPFFFLLTVGYLPAHTDKIREISLGKSTNGLPLYCEGKQLKYKLKHVLLAPTGFELWIIGIAVQHTDSYCTVASDFL